ncbi:MAG: DUF726 domain-containing protein [Halorubrum sp.]
MLGAGGAAGALAGGGVYVSRVLDGEAAGFTAPTTHPVLDSRGRALEGRPERAGSWGFEDAEAVFLFVHGFATDATDARDQAYTAERGLHEIWTDDDPVVAYSWDADIGWGDAKREADATAGPLADWLIEWADEDARPVHLLGYSLGARVTGALLQHLTERNRPDVLASVSLLGGAIPRASVTRDGTYGPAIEGVSAPVTNFHSRNDRVLGWVYRASDRVRAVGRGGVAASASLPEGYRDVDVTDLVEDHYSYFQPGAGCLERVVERIE